MSRFYLIPLLVLTAVSCRKACKVTDEYKTYRCLNGYVKHADFTKLNLDMRVDSSTHHFNQIGCDNSGNGLVINDKETFKEYLSDDALADNFNLTDKTLVGVFFTTNQGRGLYSEEFVCMDHQAKICLIKVQYELENQCAGSGITYFDYRGWMLLPKIPDTYTVEFSVEDMNPFY